MSKKSLKKARVDGWFFCFFFDALRACGVSIFLICIQPQSAATVTYLNVLLIWTINLTRCQPVGTPRVFIPNMVRWIVLTHLSGACNHSVTGQPPGGVGNWFFQ